MTMCGARRSLCGLMSLTILLHVAQIVLYPPLDAASQRSVRQSQPPATAIEPAILPPLATTAAAVRGGVSGEAEAARSAAGGGKQWRRAWILATSMACEARASHALATQSTERKNNRTHAPLGHKEKADT